jgi:putative ABC transport system ATP-binding protein
MSAMINIQNLRFEYHDGTFSLGVPSLKILDGETVAIIGVSGSGKTTLLNLIAGILRPSSGEMTVAGSDLGLLDDPALREFRISKMGLVFQEFELLEYLDVLDNILLPFRINKTLSLTKNVKDRATQLARQVGIDDKLHRYPEQL